jgi:hypothetical protein
MLPGGYFEIKQLGVARIGSMFQKGVTGFMQ